MRLQHRIAALVAGLGFATAAFAGPGKPAKDDPPAKPAPKVEKAEPKFEPKPLPKVESKPLPKIEPKAKVDPVVVLPKVDPKPVTKSPDVKPIKVDPRPVLIREKPKTGPAEKPATVGLKLPADVKFDHHELAKIKPPVDLTKTKPEAVLASKPPADFKAKPIPLGQIHVPQNAATVAKLNVKAVTANQAFVLNQNVYTKGDYHTKYGVKTAYGFAYPGQYHCHWHHCIWDPCFGCHYYYCPSACCYYYWNAVDVCYYPAYWFVDYGTVNYPWWICGGFQGYGYAGVPHVSVFIGW